jgi:Zn-dependent peptidase ImmA (M78 family)/transcriptional regulator with XRE-family HTH domain
VSHNLIGGSLSHGDWALVTLSARPMEDLKQTVANNLARFRKGARFSVEALAQETGVTRQTIHNYEAAKTLGDSATLTRIATVLGVRLDDLLRRHGDLPAFRFRAHASFDQRPQFAASVAGLLEDFAGLEQLVGVAPYAPESTPCHSLEGGGDERVKEAGAQFRQRLDLGDGPIVNLFRSAEAVGLKVLRKPVPLEGFFGLSASSPDRGAFILINTHEITIERQLFTLAHEIGHLIFHRGDYMESISEAGLKDADKAREDVANFFAGHLLVPDEALRQLLETTRSVTQLKSYFRVSYQVILSRMEQMGVGTYGDLFKRLAFHYRRQHGQPLSKKVELPPRLEGREFPENERFRRLVMQALVQRIVTESRAAELLETTVEQVRRQRKDSEENVTL